MFTPSPEGVDLGGDVRQAAFAHLTMPSTDRILKYQRIYQSKPNVPLWMRSPRSKLIVYPFYALFTYTCVLAPGFYIGRALMGKKAE